MKRERVSKLQEAIQDKLRTEFELADVSARIDERGRATVAAAPPSSGVSKRVPSGQRAVSLNALIPTGLARGDIVTIQTDSGTINGTVVSAQSTRTESPASQPMDSESEGSDDDTEQPLQNLPTTRGGDGRITIATTRTNAEKIITESTGHVVVQSQGTRREFELLALLRRSGKRLRKVTLKPTGEITGQTIGTAAILDTYGVAVLGIRGPAGWKIAPRGATPLSPNDDLFVVGPRDNLNRFQEACA